MQVCRGVDVNSLLLNLCTRWRLVVVFLPWSHNLWGKNPWVGQTASLGIFGEEENFLPLPGIKPPIIQHIASSLFQLCYADPTV